MGNEWMDAWLEAQQKYWQAWADMAQRGMRTPEAARNPFADGLDQWWKAVSTLTPPDGREVFDRLLEVGKGYFSLAEQFVGAGREGAGMDAVNAWLDGMQKMWGEWAQAGATFRPDALFAQNQFKGLTTFWDLPMDTWHRLAANVLPMPGDFTQAFHPEGAHLLQDRVNRFLAIPAVGYTREAQEQFQRLAQRQMDYMTAMQAYQGAFAKLGIDTGRRFQESLQARAKANKPITSLRELYDQWVEMSETAYADFVMTPEYQTLYGRLVNSLLALKQQMARMVDEALEALHMPTHAEIGTLQCRQQELRRDNLRMHKEIKELRRELDALRKILPGAEAADEEAKAKRQPVARTATKRK